MIIFLNIYIAIALIIVGAYWGQDCHSDPKQARRYLWQGVVFGSIWPITILIFILSKKL